MHRNIMIFILSLAERLCFLVFLSLFVRTFPIHAQTPSTGGTEWPMTAGNPERNSHNEVEIRGNLSIDWSRVIDPFVDTKVQVIAAAGKVFVSTSQGLFAFDATIGAQSWVYGTELPVGNAPTIVGNVVYLPGFDHRIQALNITSGTTLSGYTPYEAGAGYDTNPLVIDNVIYAGNRDGNFYALNAITGAKIWQYTTGGPIRFSAAYKDNVIYFVSDDSYAYALNLNGTLKWKSPKLPGAGFSNYWPVIWTDTYPSSPTYNQTFVLITGSEKATSYGWWSNTSNTDYQAENYEIPSSCTGTTNPGYLWSNSASIFDCSAHFTYFNTTRPDRRHLYIFNTNQTGTTAIETQPYAPFNWAGASHGGNKYPPIVSAQNILYTHVGYDVGSNLNGGTGGWIAGWKFGTQYIQKIWNDGGAGDDPPAFTSGGNMIYWGE
jgi:outer membrane protein assembly factor BamB